MREISELPVDARFRAEPGYLDESALNEPHNLRYRLAVAALPSLRSARGRYVGRLDHSHEEAWPRSLKEHIQTELVAD